MTPYFQQDGITLYHGDCREVLQSLPDESVHAVVTDPPYGLSFMGKRWDYDVPSVEVWQQCLRVLKPGGHLLAFAGTRTQHRMAVRIEDAGFEIRDMIAWVYGSGFPKSLDVSKAIDKVGGSRAEFATFRDAVKAAMKTNGVSRKSLEHALGNYMLSHYLTAASQPAVPNYRDYVIIRDHVGLGDDFDHLFATEAEREVVGQRVMTDTRKARAGFFGSTHSPDYDGSKRLVHISAPATPEAQRWSGWGTALKPALEPITVARKPLCGTVAENVLTHGCGGLNVDGCRVSHDEPYKATTGRKLTSGQQTRAVNDGRNMSQWEASHSAQGQEMAASANPLGRWPANLIHDGSDEVTGLFPETAPAKQAVMRAGLTPGAIGTITSGKDAARFESIRGHDDAGGSAARFFYTAKADKADRGHGNKHPTVKPVDLMRYLVRLVCPVDGLILDPFAGSGTTLVAAQAEHCRAIGIEREEQYCEFIRDERFRQRVLF